MLKAARRLEKRASSLKKSLLAMEDAPALKKRADMLMSYSHQYVAGLERAVIDFVSLVMFA